jgi:uroporphyrinogen-III decarboxylase
MALAFSDQRFEFDPDGFERATALLRDLGEQAVAVTDVGVSPLMDWLEHLAGIEQGHLLLADHPAQVEALFEAMHQAVLRRAEIIADKAPYALVYSSENTSTTLISPALFQRYCYRHLLEYGRIISAAGKHHILHMCGHLKALLPDIATLPAAAVEAFTSPPVGNTRLLDGRAACPDKCFIGGTNATLWLEDAAAIIAEVERDLDALPHTRGIVVTSAGVMPPAATPETIREVGAWVKTYPVR